MGDVQAVPLPDEAVAAAALVIHRAQCAGSCRHVPKEGSNVWVTARKALAAAGPALARDAAAAERARIRDEWRNLLMRGRFDVFRPHRILCGCISANCEVRLKLRALLGLDEFDRPLADLLEGGHEAVNVTSGSVELWFGEAAEAYRDGVAAGRAAQLADVRDILDWRNCEGIDFHVKSATSGEGITWIWLKCSLCGNVQATAEGEPSDLGGLSVAAQGHLERKHADLLRQAPAAPGGDQ